MNWNCMQIMRNDIISLQHLYQFRLLFTQSFCLLHNLYKRTHSPKYKQKHISEFYTNILMCTKLHYKIFILLTWIFQKRYDNCIYCKNIHRNQLFPLFQWKHFLFTIIYYQYMFTYKHVGLFNHMITFRCWINLLNFSLYIQRVHHKSQHHD